MLMAMWSRRKWILNFPTGEDAGQRLRTELVECVTVDTSNFRREVDYCRADVWKVEDN